MKRILVAVACLPFVACGPSYTPQVPKTLKSQELTVNTAIKLQDNSTEKREVKFTMLEVPGGKFMMGSPSDEKGRGVDEPEPREVEVKTFWLGKFEVTWDEYACFFQNEASEADAETWPSLPFEPPDRGMGREGYAAMSIQRFMAAKYCDWLSKQTGWKFRLPKEEEWEYACRAGGTIPAPEPLDEYAWHKGNSGNGPKGTPKNQKVGAKKPNAWGFHDMLGNVMEYTQADFPNDGGPVLRGGSWNDPATELRAANRTALDPVWNKRDPNRPRGVSWLTDGPFVGFRVAADGPPPSK